MATPSTGLSLLRLQDVTPLVSLSTPPLKLSEDLKRPREGEEKSAHEGSLELTIQMQSAQIFKKKKFEQSSFLREFNICLVDFTHLDSATLCLRLSSESPEKILREAASKGSKSVVEVFIATGMNLDDRDELGKTAVLLALSQGHSEIAALLIKAGAKDEKGQSPLIRAIEEKNYFLIPALIFDREMLEDSDSCGRTPLIHAVLLEDLKVLKLLLEAKPNLELKDHHNLTALHYAVGKGNSPIVAKLIENKANIESLTQNKMTPLMVASGLTHSEIVRDLLLAGAKIATVSEQNESALSQAIKNNQKHNFAILMDAVLGTSLSLSLTLSLSLSSGSRFRSKSDEDLSKDPSLLGALRTQSLEMAILLAENRIGIFYEEKTETPLIWAVKENSFDIVEILVNAEVELEREDSEKCSACVCAERLGYKKIADVLFQAGARNFQGETLITEAIIKKDLRALEGALKAFSGKNLIEKQNKRGETPLTLAIENESEEMVKLLISNGASLKSRNGAQDTPLKCAIKHGNVALIDTLILKGANVNEKDSDGCTLLIQAVMGFKNTSEESFKLQTALLKTLLSHGANLNSQSLQGKTALMFGVENNHEALVDFLIQAGALLNLKTLAGKSALDIAEKLSLRIGFLLFRAGAKESDGSSYLMERVGNDDISNVKAHIASGRVDLNAQNAIGQSALSLSLQLPSTEMMAVLLKAGANPNLQNQQGLSPLLEASSRNQVDHAKLLIQYKANLQLRAYDGSTALHFAVANRNHAMVALLISLKIDLDAQRNDRQRAIQLTQLTPATRDRISFGLLREAGARSCSGVTPLMQAAISGDMGALRKFIAKGVDVNAIIERKPNITALFYCTIKINVEGFIELVKAGAQLHYCDHSYFDMMMHRLAKSPVPEKEKYQQLIQFFFNPFAEHLIGVAETAKILCDHLHSPQNAYKFTLALLEKVPSDFHCHLLKVPFLMTNPIVQKTLMEKLPLEMLERGFEVLQKEFSSSKYGYNSLKEWRLQLSENHLKSTGDESIPSASEVDLTLFLTLFKKINFSNPELPGYAHPRMLKGDDGEPVKIEYLEDNLAKYVGRIKAREPFLGTPRPQDVEELNAYYSRLTNIARHLVIHLQEPTMDPDNRTSLLIDLANAGDHCGARYMSESFAWYQRNAMKVQPEAFTVGEKIFTLLTDFRLKILFALVLAETEDGRGVLVPVGNLPHVRNQYLELIGKEFALPGVSATHADRAFTLKELTKKNAIAKFLQLYSPTAIIDHIQEVLLNPAPSNLSYQELVYWFEAHVPDDWKKAFYDNLTKEMSVKIEGIKKAFLGLSFQQQQGQANEWIKTKIFPKYQLKSIENPRSFEMLEKVIDARAGLKSNQRTNMKKQIRQEILAFENPSHLLKLQIRELLNQHEIHAGNPENWLDAIAKHRIQEYMREEVYASEESLGFKRSALAKMLIELEVLKLKDPI